MSHAEGTEGRRDHLAPTLTHRYTVQLRGGGGARIGRNRGDTHPASACCEANENVKNPPIKAPSKGECRSPLESALHPRFS